MEAGAVEALRIREVRRAHRTRAVFQQAGLREGLIGDEQSEQVRA